MNRLEKLCGFSSSEQPKKLEAMRSEIAQFLERCQIASVAGPYIHIEDSKFPIAVVIDNQNVVRGQIVVDNNTFQDVPPGIEFQIFSWFLGDADDTAADDSNLSKEAEASEGRTDLLHHPV